MRMLVFFDLPVVTDKERKIASKFRRFLQKDGYAMVQWSVYSRICNGVDAVSMHKNRLKLNLPEQGSIRLLVLTEKQYEAMEILVGEKSISEASATAELVDIF